MGYPADIQDCARVHRGGAGRGSRAVLGPPRPSPQRGRCLAAGGGGPALFGHVTASRVAATRRLTVRPVAQRPRDDAIQPRNLVRRQWSEASRQTGSRRIRRCRDGDVRRKERRSRNGEHFAQSLQRLKARRRPSAFDPADHLNRAAYRLGEIDLRKPHALPVATHLAAHVLLKSHPVPPHPFARVTGSGIGPASREPLKFAENCRNFHLL